MTSRTDRRRLNSRRRRRRLVRGLVRGAFWSLVLVGVFILGLGYGKTIGEDDAATGNDVTITQDRGAVVATLPTKTVTVVKTVTAPKKSASRSKGSKRER